MQSLKSLLMLTAKRLVSILTLVSLAALAWYAALLARADVAFGAFGENTLIGVSSAVRLAPGNAAYHALLAEFIEASGGNPDHELEMATDLSPHESKYWIRRAFRAEVEQQYGPSEHFLQEALKVDHGFDPRWALMNYYFRRGDSASFWKYTREALEMSYGNLDPIFRLCLAVSDDPSVTRRVLPPHPQIRLGFLTYLIANGYVGSAAGIADEVASEVRADDSSALLDYCDRQIGHDNESAVRVWNALCRRRIVPFTELSPQRGHIVTNGDFAVASFQRVFDWKYGTNEAIAIRPAEDGRAVAINIRGDQPDSIVLMQQEIPLSPGREYAVQYEYRLVGPPGDSGVHWVIRRQGQNEVGGSGSMAISPVLLGSDWNGGKMLFSAGQLDVATLALEYRRTPGTIRWKGAVQIRHVASGLAEPVSTIPGTAK